MGLYVEGDLPVVTTNGNSNGTFGNGWEGLIGLALVAGLFDGGFGGGFGGNRGGFGGCCYGGGYVTNDELQMGFFRNDVSDKLDGLNYGIADATFALNNTITNGFAGVQNTLCQGFSGVNLGLTTQGYETRNAIDGVSRQLADCCCSIQKELLENRYINAKNTCDIIRSSENNTRAILDYLTGEKISSLQSENAGLKAQISNDRQSAYIVNALSPKCPQPAYVVQPPQEVTFPTNCCGNVAYANFNNGCGCC